MQPVQAREGFAAGGFSRAVPKRSRNRVCASIVAVCVLLSAPVYAQVNALPSLPHLLVKGQASRDVVPDRFTVSVNVSSLDLQPDVAREAVQRNLAALIRTARSSDALPDSINATVFSVVPEYDYVQQQRVFKGTRVNRQLQATFASAEATRRFLAGIQTSEDVTLGGVQPGYAEEAALRSQLKAEAMQETRATAALLAKSYGTRLGGLYSVSDVAPSFAYGIQAGQWPQARRGNPAYPPAPPEPPPPQADAAAVVDVTGTRITPESLAVGTITIAEQLYAVFLLAD